MIGIVGRDAEIGESADSGPICQAAPPAALDEPTP